MSQDRCSQWEKHREFLKETFCGHGVQSQQEEKAERRHTLKCKLKTIVKSSEVLSKVKTKVVLAHEIFKRTTSFFRLFCLERGETPCANLS